MFEVSPWPTSDLTVRFLDDEFLWPSDAPLTFGRVADLVLDTHPGMQAVMGSIVNRSGFWWGCNASDECLIVRDYVTSSSMRIASGGSLPIAMESAEIVCSVGAARYSFDISLRHATPSTTVRATTPVVRLNEEQQQLIEVLCKSDGDHAGLVRSLKSNAEMAAELGWSLPKFNRKLDNLCLKFSRLGVHGLHGSKLSLASDRRRRLVEHCLDAGIVPSAHSP